MVQYDCPVKKCSRKGGLGFGRKDHLREHLKDVHMQSAEQARQLVDEVHVTVKRGKGSWWDCRVGRGCGGDVTNWDKAAARGSAVWV